MNYMEFIITFAFIVLDFLSGIIKAFATHGFASTKMREGLFHKIGLLLCLILGYMIDFAQVYLDLGFTVPVAAAICVYITMMEISSIIENACKINPELMPDKLLKIFGGIQKED